MPYLFRGGWKVFGLMFLWNVSMDQKSCFCYGFSHMNPGKLWVWPMASTTTLGIHQGPTKSTVKSQRDQKQGQECMKPKEVGRSLRSK